MPQDIVSILDGIQINQFATNTDRFAAKEATRRLLARLETPFERGWTLIGEDPGAVAALQLVQDLGIWAKWKDADLKSPGTARTLDDLVGWADVSCEPNLLRRLLRHLAALHFIEETDVDTWKPTSFSIAMGDKATYCGDLIKGGLDHPIPAGHNLPKFLSKHGYKEPLDIASFDNYRDVFGQDFFSYGQEHPDAGSSFHGVMAAVTLYKMPWTDVYDTKSLVSDADLTQPLFIDVGGGQGLDSQRLLDLYPDFPADILIVQDLPEVIQNYGTEEIDKRIRKMPHDFFKPQPIVGARAYFFHAVPHDWPDADVVRMLTEVKNAMRTGYSKLLIYEIVLPPLGASHFQTTLDLALMSCTSGLERTEIAWRALLKELGLRISSISRHPMALESVIEAEIA